MDGGKGNNRRQGSLDDILGDLLSEDTPKKQPLSNSRKGKRGVKDDDFYSNLAAVAGGDPESDISEADVDQVAKSIADLDDMDADLFGGPSKRNSVKSRSGKPTTPRRSSNTPRSRSGTPRRTPGSPTRGESSPRGSIKRPPPKPSSPSPPSTDYKPGTAPGKMTDLGRESENLKPGQSFRTDSDRPQTVPKAKPKIDYGEFNEDDPLAGLLSDEEDSFMETKKKPALKKTLDKRSSSDDIFGSSEPKVDSPFPTESKAPEGTTTSLYDRPPTRSGSGTVTPNTKPADVISNPVPKRREERLFSDDDSMLDGLGIDEKPKTPVKTAVSDEDALRPARSALDSLLGKDSVNKHLQKAERKEFILDTKKFSQKDEDSDEDLVFGDYKPSSVGGGSRPTSRRSVRFQDDDIFGADDKPPSRGRPDSAKSSKPDDMDWLELASGNRESIDVKDPSKSVERKDTKSSSKTGSFDWLGLKDSSDEDKDVNQSETRSEKKTLSRHEDNDDWLSKLKAMNHGEDEVDTPAMKEKTTPVVKEEPKVTEARASSPDKDDYLGLGKEINLDDILTKKPESPSFPGKKSMSDRRDIFDDPPTNDSVDASMRRRRLLLDDDDDIFPPIESKPISKPEEPIPSNPRIPLSSQLADLQQLDESPYFKKKVQKPPSTSESQPPTQSVPEASRVIQSTVYPSRVPNAVRNVITPPSTSYNTPTQPSYQQQYYSQQPVHQPIPQSTLQATAYSTGPIILPNTLHEAHAMIQKLGVEKQYTESLLDSTRKRYEDEIQAVETSFRNRMKILEESNQKKEARLREETEQLMEKHLSRVRLMEEEKSELANENYRKLEEIERMKAKDLEMLKEQHRLSLSELKREHLESIERLKEAKNQEINAVANANDTSRSLTAVVEQIQTSAKDIGSLQTQVESIHRNGLDEREISLKAKDQQLQNLQERLSRQEEDNEKERKRLEDLISRMETQMKEQTRLLDEERWKMKSESTRLEANQRSLEEEKRVWLEQQNRERSSLERARDNFQEEQRSSLSQLNTERRNLAEERMKWNVDLKLHREQSHQEAIKMAQTEAEYEVLTKTIAEEKTRSAGRKHELHLEEERLANEKARIEREKANLETEKENLSSRALQLKSKIAEIDSMTELANRTQSEGDRSLMEARNLESQHNQRLNNIQHELQKLKNMESNIAQEKLKISKERQELEKLRNSSLCVNCRSPINGGLVNGTVAIPNGQPMMNSPNNMMMSTPLPGVYGNKYSSPAYNSGQLSVNAIETITASIAHDRSVRMWKIQALKDKDYLEEESMFLETLKHSPYHSSHS